MSVQENRASEDDLVLDMAGRPWWIHAREQTEAEQRARGSVPWLRAALTETDGNGGNGSSQPATPFGSAVGGPNLRRNRE